MASEGRNIVHLPDRVPDHALDEHRKSTIY